MTLRVCLCKVWKAPDSLSYCSYMVLCALVKRGWDWGIWREGIRVTEGKVAVFSADPLPPWCCLSFVLAGKWAQGWNTDSSSLPLSSLSLSHPRSLRLSSPPHILYILSAQLPPPSQPPHPVSWCSCTLSTQIVHPPLLFSPPLPIHPSIWPRSTPPAAWSITLRLHHPAPFLLLPSAFFAPFSVSPLILPSASSMCFLSQLSFPILISVCTLSSSPIQSASHHLSILLSFPSISLQSVQLSSQPMWVTGVMRREIRGVYMCVFLWQGAREETGSRVTLRDMENKRQQASSDSEQVMSSLLFGDLCNVL